MIRQPVTPAQTTTRNFTSLLTALRSFWEPYAADPDVHVAQGLLSTKHGACTATLTFDEPAKRVGLMVRLPLHDRMDMPRLCMLLQLQNRTLSLASLVFDAEHGTLLLVSSSVLPNLNVASEVVAQVVADALRVLEDEDLINLLN